MRVGLLNGPLGDGIIDRIEAESVWLRCSFNDDLPPRPKIDLLLAMPRPKVMKRLWAQLAALGVGKVVLLRADKVERYYFDSHVIEPRFYIQRLIEGLQQACCTHLPDISIQPRFKPFVEDDLDAQFGDHLKLLADPSGARRLSSFFPVLANRRIALAVGPEGGWTPYERNLLQEHGYELFGLGPRVLRTDTVCVGLLTMLSELSSG